MDLQHHDLRDQKGATTVFVSSNGGATSEEGFGGDVGWAQAPVRWIRPCLLAMMLDSRK